MNRAQPVFNRKIVNRMHKKKFAFPYEQNKLNLCKYSIFF